MLIFCLTLNVTCALLCGHGLQIRAIRWGDISEPSGAIRWGGISEPSGLQIRAIRWGDIRAIWVYIPIHNSKNL